MNDFLIVSGASLLATVLVMGVTCFIAWRGGTFVVVDTAWGLGFVVVGIVAAVLGDGDLTRRVLLAVLVAVWGLRLAWHVHTRNKGKGEDQRYADMLEGKSFLTSARKVFGVQGLALWFVSLPVQVSAVSGEGITAVLVLGVLLWMLGVFFEAVGDRQVAAFKANPANKGKIMDQGLWAWTRHPNYFGDSAVWWGIWLIAASAWPGVLTLLSPVAMTYFLAFATGARLLERYMSKRDGWAEYAAKTPMFFPRPPRR